MSFLFHETITSWKDWGRVFQSIPAFSPLLEEIFRREGLPYMQPQNLTPGTNAVFRVGKWVAKVFFPKESGLDPLPDFRNEAAVCGKLASFSVPTPLLAAQGEIRDKYLFYYLITEYCPGEEAGHWLSHVSGEQKAEFVRQIKALLSKMNQPADGLIPPIDLLKRSLENPRLKELPPSLAQEMMARAKTLPLSPAVLVHGDLTGENLLVDQGGRIVLIDCADACLAPPWYELGPLVFELFQCDRELLRAFAADDPNSFVERTIDALCIHDFGASLLTSAASRSHRPAFLSLKEVKAFLGKRFS